MTLKLISLVFLTASGLAAQCASGLINVIGPILNPDGSTWNGSIVYRQQYNASTGTTVVQGAQMSVNVTNGALSLCLVPGFYSPVTLRQSGSNPYTVTTSWTVPSYGPINVGLIQGPVQVLNGPGTAPTVSYVPSAEPSVTSTVQAALDGNAVYVFGLNNAASAACAASAPTCGTQNMATINAALAAAAATGTISAQVIAPAGQFPLNGTIASVNATQPKLICNGTTFLWYGNTTGPMIQFKGDLQPRMSGCYFLILNASYPLTSGAAWELLDNTSPSSTSTDADFENNVIFSGNNLLYDGVIVDGLDANNDFHYFKKNRISGYSHSCFNLQGGQSYSHKMDANQCLGVYNGSTGRYGVTTAGASFDWYGGGLSNSVCDFNLTGVTISPINIYNPDVEGSGSLVCATQNQGGINIHGGRIVDTSNSNTVMINNAGGGTVHVYGTQFQPASGNTGAVLTFVHTPNGSFPGSFTLEDAVLYNHNWTSDQLFPASLLGSALNFINSSYSDPTSGANSMLALTAVNGGQAIKYSTGTVTFTTGMTVTGSGTAWTAAMASNGTFSCGGVPYTIASVVSATSLTVANNNAGACNAGSSYLLTYNAAVRQVQSFNSGPATLGPTSVNGTLGATGNAALLGVNTIGKTNYVIGNGQNNAIVTAAGSGPALAEGIPIFISLNFSLQAGANTLNYQGTGVLPLKNQYGNNLVTGFNSSQVIWIIYNDNLNVWQIIGAT